jgi:DUF1680 family protein
MGKYIDNDLEEKGEVALTQETDYPWDGNVRVNIG